MFPRFVLFNILFNIFPFILLALLLGGKLMPDSREIALLIILFIFLPFSIILQGVDLYLIKNYNNQNNLKTADILRGGYKLCVSVFILSMAVAIFIALGYAFFVVPGIIIVLFYFVALPTLVNEQEGVSAAFEKCVRHMKGYKLKVFGLLLLLGAMYIPVAVLLKVIEGKLLPWLIGESAYLGLIVVFVFKLIMTLIALCFGYILSFVVYDVIRSGKIEDWEAFKSEKGAKYHVLRIASLCLAVLGVVLGVYIVLSSITSTVSSITSAQNKAQDAALKSKVSRMRTSLMIYQDMNNKYPKNLEELCERDSLACSGNDYKNFSYTLLPGGNSYKLCTKLSDNKTDFCVEGNTPTNSNRKETREVAKNIDNVPNITEDSVNDSMESDKQTEGVVAEKAPEVTPVEAIESTSDKSKDAAFKSYLTSLRPALFVYRNTKNKFPTTFEDLLSSEFYHGFSDDKVYNERITYTVSPDGNSYKLCILLTDNKNTHCLSDSN